MKKSKHNLCLVSNSGGHWEQCKKLKPLIDKHGGFFVTEKTKFGADEAKYLMIPTDLKDRWWIPKMMVNFVHAAWICLKERPDYVISCGSMAVYPFYIYSFLFRKKFIHVETFGRANMATVTGKKVEKHANLFIVQWESQKKFYKNAIYGGCLY